MINVKQIFEEYYGTGDVPLFTPFIYEYASKSINPQYTLLFEKSEGEGLFGTPLYGCSVLIFDKWKKTVRKINLSKSFESKNGIEDYILSLSNRDIYNSEIFGKVYHVSSEYY